MTEVIGIIIDTETGGLDPKRDALLQVGAVAFGIERAQPTSHPVSVMGGVAYGHEPGRLVEIDSFTVDVYPALSLSVCARALSVSNTPIAEVWNPSRIAEPDAYQNLLEWMGRHFPDKRFHGKLWAHRASFDAGFLCALYERVEIEVSGRELGRVPRPEQWNCAMSFAGVLQGAGRLAVGSKSLSNLCKQFGIDTARDQDGHDALMDARLTLEVMNHLWKAAGWL